MMTIWSVARKELSIYFTTLMGYASLGAYAFLMGLIFISAVNRYQEATVSAVRQQRPEVLEQLNFNASIIGPMFTTGVWMLLVFVPFLTMRLFAEEKANRTFELLMTAPVRSIELVLGKFLGAALMVLVMVLVPLVFPAILDAYGTSSGTGGAVDWAPVLSAVLSIFLLGLTFTGIGLFISAATESPIVSALLTFAVLLLGFVLPLIAARLDGNWATAVDYLAPASHVVRGLQGRLRSSDIVYFVSLTGLFLFFTQRTVESHRWR